MTQTDVLSPSSIDACSRDSDRFAIDKLAAGASAGPRPRLSEQQALQLVRLLASSEEFRALTVAHPREALQQLGVSAEQAARMIEPSAAATCRLAEKAVFVGLLESMQSDASTVRMDMSVPQLRVD
jgi:putative modified peptide